MPRHNSYTVEVDYSRNCYSYGRSGHIVMNCRNWKIVEQRRRLEYRDNSNVISNLNGEESLVALN